jgi:hypothetical protein
VQELSRDAAEDDLGCAPMSMRADDEQRRRGSVDLPEQSFHRTAFEELR